MTPDKTPTEAELKALLPTKKLARDEAPKVQVWLTQSDALAFARAALAKWGSPVVAGEPEGWITWWPTAASVREDAEQQCHDWRRDRDEDDKPPPEPGRPPIPL